MQTDKKLLYFNTNIYIYYRLQNSALSQYKHANPILNFLALVINPDWPGWTLCIVSFLFARATDIDESGSYLIRWYILSYIYIVISAFDDIFLYFVGILWWDIATKNYRVTNCFKTVSQKNTVRSIRIIRKLTVVLRPI